MERINESKIERSIVLGGAIGLISLLLAGAGIIAHKTKLIQYGTVGLATTALPLGYALIKTKKEIEKQIREESQNYVQ